ncbi:MAG: murein transglycosylase A [Deltaproteobacteria bacterium]|nr:murein transglycosylase A [Deltaproteobacteria bacterium]
MQRVVPWVATVLLLSVAACGPTGRAPGASLRRLAAAPAFVDDGDRASLAAAVGESVRYFARLPADRPLAFGPTTYTAGEMRAALEGVAELLTRAPSAAELAVELGRRFDVYRVAPPGGVTFTGYYLPILPARATRDARFRVPVLGRPSDLVTASLADFGAPCACREQVVGRVVGGALAPYFTRAEIDAGAARGGSVLAWIDDPVGLFFLQIQGSGVLVFPDGTRRTIGFAASNGRPYTSIGRVLVDRGELTLDQASMAGIREWLRIHPEEEARLLQTNARYVFFRTLDGPPLGSLGVPVTTGRTIATDPMVFPPGALAFISVPEAGPGVALSRLVLNQDAGAAIRGAGRVDVYFGDATDAAAIAGRLRSAGDLYFFAPRAPRAR